LPRNDRSINQHGEFLMRIFVTGATGFIGSAVVYELIKAGHEVLGMTRSDAGAEALEAAGAASHRGDLTDLASLRKGTSNAEAVIHCAFDHDFSKYIDNCEQDRRVIEALGNALLGSNRPLIITSVTSIGNVAAGQPATEDDFNHQRPNPRIASELAAEALLLAGVNVSSVRLPQVHNPVKHGLVTFLLALARQKGASAYVGDRTYRWPAAHVRDVARVYRLAVERGEGAQRYHAVAEEGVSTREVAEVIGRGLNVPVVPILEQDAAEHFGWLAMFAKDDMPASSAWTRRILGWTPQEVGMLEDLTDGLKRGVTAG
jgi:nucleoside-diphosphate-sugar epimerase